MLNILESVLIFALKSFTLSIWFLFSLKSQRKRKWSTKSNEILFIRRWIAYFFERREIPILRAFLIRF